jgi:kynurenine formamidase
MPVPSRWGEEDERGALNLVSVHAVRRGLSSAVAGRVVSLAAPIVPGKGFGLVGRQPPALYMTRDGADYAAGLPERGGFGFADDVITLPTHGVTHLDALAHVWEGGEMYNGFPASAVTSRGARHLGIEHVSPIVTRGVLVDVTTEGDEVARPVGVEELSELVERSGHELMPGDALLLRTGWLDAVRAGRTDSSTWPGLDRDCAPWLIEHEVAVIGADNAGVECFPSSDPGCQVPLHVALLRDHGVYFCELMELTELAAALAEAGRSTFLFAVGVLPIVGAVGSPVSPIAVL